MLPSLAEFMLGNSSAPTSGSNSTYDKCAWDSGPAYIDYRYVHECMFDGKWEATLLLFIIWMVFLFYVLISTTTKYFCPALSRMSERLRLSNHIIGVTFVAIGNGAPDLFTTFATVRFNEFDIAFGGLLGAAIFSVTMLVAVTVLASKGNDPSIARRPFFRDLVFFLLSLGAVVYIFSNKKVEVWEGAMLVCLWVLYIIFVLVARVIYQMRQRARRKEFGILDGEDEELLNTVDAGAAGDTLLFEDILYFTNKRESKQDPFLRNSELAFQQEDDTMWSRFKRYVQRNVSRLGWHSKTTRERVIFVLQSPLTFLRSVTIPPVQESTWNKLLAVVCMVGGPTFLLFATKTIALGFTIKSTGGFFPIVSIAILLGIILAIVVAQTTQETEPPKFFVVIVIYGFIISASWMYLSCLEIVYMLKEVCEIMHWSKSIIGLLILAWGNAASDLVANIVLARRGFGSIAIAASYAAPTFNILLGLGLGFSFRAVTDRGSIPVTIDNNTLVALVFLGVIVLLTLIIVPLSKWKIRLPFALSIVIIYIVFMIVCVLTELDVIFKKPIWT